MKVIDIVKTSATLLAREDVCDYLINQSTTPSRETLLCVDLLTRLTNLVISELADGQIMMIKEADVNNNSQSYPFPQGVKPIKIFYVLNEEGRKVDFITTEFGVKVEKGYITKLAYSYVPPNYGLTDRIGNFEKSVSVGILSYGVCAEYCLTEGKFEQAVMWHKRYCDSIDALITIKNANIKGRSFV